MIGLIFGDTDFPKEILKTVKKRKIKYLIIDLSKSKKFKQDRKSYSVSIGQFGKIINILKENSCKKVLFAGKVNKPNFSKLRLDFKGIYYIPRIIKASKLGDAAILKEIIKILSQNKIKHVKQVKNMPNLEKLNLSENPLCLIFPDAFTQINELGTLMLDSTAFQNPEQDLEFLKNQESNLIMLSINRAFPRQNIHTIEYLSFLKMGRCLTLHL